jgi:hypothetical protein
MIRTMSAVVAVGVLAVASDAQAAAGGDTFGDEGHFIISADRLIPLVGYSSFKTTYTDPQNDKFSYSTSSTSSSIFWGGGEGLPFAVATTNGGNFQNVSYGIPNPYKTPRIGFDYVLIPNLTIGGNLFAFFTFGSSGNVHYENGNGTQTSDFKVDVPNASILGIAPRVGYILRLSDLIGFWFRGGFFYFTEGASVDVHDQQGNVTRTDSINAWQFGLSLDPQLVITPWPHFGIMAGLTGDIPIAGGASYQRVTGPQTDRTSYSFTSFYFGATAGIFVWF